MPARASRSLYFLVASTVAGCMPIASVIRESTSIARSRSGLDATYRPIDRDGNEVEGDHETDADASVRRLLAAPIGPNDAVRIALARDPNLQAAFEQLGVARADLLGASLPPNLEFDLEARLGRTGQSGDELEAHVVIDVTDVVTLPLRRAAARAELEAAQVDAAEAILTVAFEVRSAFVHHLAAMRLQAAMLDVVRSTRAAFELTSALFEAGNVPRVDLVSQRAMYEESRLWLAEAELDVLETRETLVRTMGLFGDEVAFEVVARLDDPAASEVDMDELESRVVERNLHLSAEQYRLEAVARRRGVARIDGLLPSLRAGVSISLANQQPAYGPAASLSIPLWNHGQGAVRRLDAELRVELRRFEADAIALRSTVRRARLRLESARERVLFVRETVLPLRAEVVSESVRQYNAMQATPFQVLEARRAEVDATRTYVRVLRDYWLARVVLVHLLAGGRADFDEARSMPDEEGGF